MTFNQEFNVCIYDVPEGIDITKFNVAGHRISGQVIHEPTHGVLLTVAGSVGDAELEVYHTDYDVMGVDVYIV